jgi:hypothetical protein
MDVRKNTESERMEEIEASSHKTGPRQSSYCDGWLVY